MMTKEEVRAELARLQEEAGRVQIETIKPGMSEEAWAKAAAEVLRVLNEGQ